MQTTSWMPIRINPEVCSGCNSCVDSCPNDVLAPNPEKGKPPIVLNPNECDCMHSTMTFTWMGICIMDCPLWEKGAITRYDPWYMRPRIKRGEVTRKRAQGGPEH